MDLLSSESGNCPSGIVLSVEGVLVGYWPSGVIVLVTQEKAEEKEHVYLVGIVPIFCGYLSCGKLS